MRAALHVFALVAVTVAIAPLVSSSPKTTVAAACVPAQGPGIAPPASVPSGIEGFHAAWYGQSGYQSLCPGQVASAVVAFYNSGSFGWVSGRMGEAAYLGTWDPEPGQDRPSALGGDGQFGSPATGWPRYNRVATQPAAYVGPGQVAWFQFSLRAPSTPGTYRLALRPLIEGATWMEDYGVFWVFTVLPADGGGGGGGATPAPTAASTGTPPPTSPTPQPTASPPPTATPLPTPTATPGTGGACMEVIGFSQTQQWYFGGPPGFDQFLSQMPPRGTQLRWQGGAAIDSWADPSFWPDLVNSCASGSSSPDRVVLNISGGYSSDVSWWHDQIRLAVTNVRNHYPAVRTIYLQPVVGGPNHAICPPLPGVRASYNEPYIGQAIDRLQSEGVGVWGANPLVRTCADYADYDPGHLTDDAKAYIATIVGGFYRNR
jgi:hypothetical protein